MNRARVSLAACLLLAAGGWLFHVCDVNQNISFLAPGPGQWIVYPAPPSVPILNVMPMTAVFRRQFVLPRSPAAAIVRWRCFKQGELSINGRQAAATTPSRWKKSSRLDAASYLHAGANELEARVACDNGLPALSLQLETEGAALKSDENWEVSLEGAVWQRAWPASKPVEPRPGNGIYGTEELPGAFGNSWPLLSLFAVLAALAAAACEHWGGLLAGKGRAAGLLALAAAWGWLLLHNFPLLPAKAGFDASAHLAYIQYIQEHAALPSAGQGWEFFQAPLYYLLGADWLGLLHISAAQPEAGQVLGLLNLLMGAVELGLILAGLRLLFPGRDRLQCAGLALAAFWPLQLYLLHYPTNETLGALMATAAFFVCLKILRQENPPRSWYAGLGVLLGMALLSKASAVLALAAVGLALAAKARLARESPSGFLRKFGLTFVVCLLIGGRPYWRLWRQFGNPLAGNWDPAVGGGWWQLPGYRAPSYYLEFGHALARPFFSGFRSFWGCLYSTCWGDGLMGGVSQLAGRPPWNYNLMAVGYVLALAPSALVLIGFCRALRQGLRGRVDWLFLAGAPLLFGFAIFSMSLKLPFYSQAKALYALPAVLPCCALGTLGLDYWAARFARARLWILLWLGVWLLTVYASFWIRPGSVETLRSEAIGLYKVPGQDPGPALERVLALAPGDPEAILGLAYLDRASGHLSRAVSRLEKAAQSETNAFIDTGLAQCLGEQGRLTEALEWAARGFALGPDYPAAPSILCSLALQAGQNERAARAGSWALRLKPQDGQVHFNTGLAWERLNRHREAAEQFSEAVDCSPQRADAHFWLGVALWNLPGRRAGAREQVAAAVQLDPLHPEWKARLSAMQRDVAIP